MILPFENAVVKEIRNTIKQVSGYSSKYDGEVKWIGEGHCYVSPKKNRWMMNNSESDKISIREITIPKYDDEMIIEAGNILVIDYADQENRWTVESVDFNNVGLTGLDQYYKVEIAVK